MARMGRMSVIMDLVAKKFNNDVMSAQKKIARFAQKARKSINRISFRKAALSAAAFGYALQRLGRHFIAASDIAEQYAIRLNILLRSQAEGNRLFKEMADFASRVPFSYEKIMGAATSLAGIMKGGVDEIKRWMPLIGDLAAVTGMTIQDTTSQVIRMYSAGAAAADTFRDLGILGMLGFKAKVAYTAEETRKMMFKSWTKADSQFRGAMGGLAKTWKGLMSMMGDTWFKIRNQIMEGGLFEFLKSEIKAITAKLNQMAAQGAFIKLGGEITKYIISIQIVLKYIDKWAAGLITVASMSYEIIKNDLTALREFFRLGGQIQRIYDEEIKRLKSKLATQREITRLRIAELRAGGAAAGGGIAGGGGVTGGGGLAGEIAGAPLFPGAVPLWKGGEPEWVKGMQAYKRNVEEMGQSWVNFADQVQWSWSSAIEDMIRGTRTFKDAAHRMFHDVLQSYISMISQMAAKRLFEYTVPFLRSLPFLSSAGPAAPVQAETGMSYRESSAGPANVYVQVTGPSADQIVEIVDMNIKRKGVLRYG